MAVGRRVTRVRNERIHVGWPRFTYAVGTRPTATVRALSAAAELPQSASKLAPKDAVDDEVDGRVCGHDDVAEVVVVVGQSARVGHADHVEQLVDERRRLAH